jgi:YidC/Oxa1 family membrane protein insertase
MDKNTVIAIILSTIVVVIGFSLQNTLFPPEKTPTAQKTELNTAKSEATTMSAPNDNAVVKLLPEVVTADANASSAVAPVENLTEEHPVLENDLVRVEFTNRGGDIVSYKLKQHNDKKDSVEMAEFTTPENRAFSVILGNAGGTVIDQLFNVKRLDDNTIGFYQTMYVENSDGTKSKFTLAKQYQFVPSDYMFTLTVTIVGDENFNGLQFGKTAYTIKTSPQIGPEWINKDQYEYRRFYQFTNGKKKVINLSAGQTKKVEDSMTWAGVTGKYFSLVVLPENGIQNATFSMVSPDASKTVSQMLLSRGAITANKTSDVWRIYIGPRTEKELGKYNVAANNPYSLNDVKIDRIVESSGILAPLEVLLKWCMEFFYMLIPNWGVSIIILTILMRAILFPFTKKSSEASVRMQELQPKMQEIQTKYKENPQKMNEEMAKFYQTVGYNPLSGCLPVLIQFPLIFAMYNLFNNYFEFRGAMFIPGWVPDLSQGDSVLNFGFTIPLLGWTCLRLLPIIYVFSQLIYGKVTQTPSSAQQNSSMKVMLYGMPIFFFFMFYNAPSGLLIYWIFSNMLTLVQQVIINRMMKAGKGVSVNPKPVKK